VNAFYLYTSARLDPSEPDTFRAAPSARAEKSEPQPLAHYQPVVDRNLFQTKATAAVIPQAVDVEGLQQTSLKLKLWGTVTGSEKEAYAVIEETAKRTQNLFRIGDSVQDATLKMILREKVVLSVKGRDEILEIEKPADRAGSARPSASYAAARSRAGAKRRAPRSQKITLRRALIDEALQDVNQLLSDVSIRPHFQDGQPDGLMLSRVKPNSLFMRMGLRNGDVINGVNGQQLQSVDDAMSFYEKLKESDQVTVQLKRGGRERTIQYSIR
jgi:general secretion pathway protein C